MNEETKKRRETRRRAYQAPTACPECHKKFKGTVGMSTHRRKTHGKETALAVAPKPKRKRTIEHAQHDHSELYAYVTAKLEDVIHRVALEHDLPERQFAQGFAQYLQRP